MSIQGKVAFSIPVCIEKDDGGYHAFSPALKGLHTCGETLEEAEYNLKNALIAYLTSLINHGDPIPLGCLVTEEKKKSKKKFFQSPPKQQLVEIAV